MALWQFQLLPFLIASQLERPIPYWLLTMTVEYAPSQAEALAKSFKAMHAAYMLCDDFEGFISDLSIFIEAHVEDPSELIIDLKENRASYLDSLVNESACC